MTFDERRSTGSRRLGDEAMAADSGITCADDVSQAPINAASDTAFSTEMCCTMCFEDTCVFDCTINQQFKCCNFIINTEM